MKTSMLVTIAALAAATASAAGARSLDTVEETVSVKVEYGDLNLATQEGKDTLKRRIRRAADVVCGEPDARDLVNSSVYRNCMSNATNGAWAQIHWPQPQG